MHRARLRQPLKERGANDDDEKRCHRRQNRPMRARTNLPKTVRPSPTTHWLGDEGASEALRAVQSTPVAALRA